MTCRKRCPLGTLQVARTSQGALVGVAALHGGQGPCREDDDPEAGCTEQREMHTLISHEAAECAELSDAERVAIM